MGQRGTGGGPGSGSRWVAAIDAVRVVGLVCLVALLAVAACSTPLAERSTDGTSPSTVPSTGAQPPAEGGDESNPPPPGGSDPSPPEVEVEPDSFTEPLLSDDEVAALIGELGGQLAIGLGPALAVARPDGGAFRPIGVESEVAAQPTWSGDGLALAWASVSRDRQVALVQRFDEEGRPDGDHEVSEADGPPIFYLQWDSANQRLAYLRNAPERGQVELGFAEPGQPVHPIDRGAPLFIDWAPDRPRLLAHVDESSLRYHALDPEVGDGERSTELLPRGGGYAAPAWIEADRAVVVDEGALAVVTVTDPDPVTDPDASTAEPAVTVEPLEEVGGPIAFVVSPDGRRVAYRLLSGEDESGVLEAAATNDRGDHLIVLDLETGEREVVTDEGPVAWEWSPDGSRLAWLTVEVGPAILGRWHFAATDGSATGTVRSPRFTLTRPYVQAYLPFFSQYANSMTGWAPDSSAFAFAGTVDRHRGIWVQLVDRAAPPRLVAGGDIVTWGPGPTPDDTSTPSAA